MTKTAAKAMEYEVTGTKNVNNPSEVLRKAYKMEVQKRSTMYTLYLLAAKHKVALLAIGNVILVLNWAVPEWTSIVLGLLGH